MAVRCRGISPDRDPVGSAKTPINSKNRAGESEFDHELSHKSAHENAHECVRTNAPESVHERYASLRHEKGTQTQVFESDIFWWGGGLPREGVGTKKFGMSLETWETNFFLQGVPGFCWDIPGAPESLRKRNLCSILGLYSLC